MPSSELDHVCGSCRAPISCDESANSCGRCDRCFAALSDDERDRLYAQEMALSVLIAAMYPSGTIDG